MVIVYIKKNQFAVFSDKYNLDKYFLNDGFKKIVLDDKYSDCDYRDFNEDLFFNPVKYQTRKTIELSKQKIAEFKSKLASLDYKTIKYTQGELSYEEFEKVKEECKYYRNEINSLENMIKNS